MVQIDILSTSGWLYHQWVRQSGHYLKSIEESPTKSAQHQHVCYRHSGLVLMFQHPEEELLDPSADLHWPGTLIPCQFAAQAVPGLAVPGKRLRACWRDKRGPGHRQRQPEPYLGVPSAMAVPKKGMRVGIARRNLCKHARTRNARSEFATSTSKQNNTSRTSHRNT